MLVSLIRARMSRAGLGHGAPGGLPPQAPVLMTRLALLTGVAALLLFVLGALAEEGSAAAVIVVPPAHPPLAPGVASAGCLPGGRGYLRARIRGALNLDIDWRDAQLECDGGLRPGGHGIRLSFAGPMPRGSGPMPRGSARLRVLFGIRASVARRTGRELPTNVTVIVEGQHRLFATRGEDKCTLDRMRKELLAPAGSAAASYRVSGRGFCTGPATTLSGSERIILTRFDFAGRLAESETTPPAAPAGAAHRSGV